MFYFLTQNFILKIKKTLHKLGRESRYAFQRFREMRRRLCYLDKDRYIRIDLFIQCFKEHQIKLLSELILCP